jgi:hypothetical protein
MIILINILIKFSFSNVPNLLLIITIYKALNTYVINVHHQLFCPRLATDLNLTSVNLV